MGNHISYFHSGRHWLVMIYYMIEKKYFSYQLLWTDISEVDSWWQQYDYYNYIYEYKYLHYIMSLQTKDEDEEKTSSPEVKLKLFIISPSLCLFIDERLFPQKRFLLYSNHWGRAIERQQVRWGEGGGRRDGLWSLLGGSRRSWSVGWLTCRASTPTFSLSWKQQNKLWGKHKSGKLYWNSHWSDHCPGGCHTTYPSLLKPRSIIQFIPRQHRCEEPAGRK